MEINKTNILQINYSNGGGGAHKLSQLLHDGLKAKFNMSMLVELKFGKDPSIQRLSNNASDVYSKYFKLQSFISDIFGLSFNGAKIFLNRNKEFLNKFKIFFNSDIVHLHNLQDKYFDLGLLPEISKSKKIIWTLHDMWGITANCPHEMECKQWINKKCSECNHRMGRLPMLFGNMEKMFSQKEKIYDESVLNIVTPSNWLANLVKKSMLKNHSLKVIPNGINTDIYKPISKEIARNRLGLPKDKFIILFSANCGLSNPWKGGAYVENIINNDTSEDNYYVILGEKKEFQSNKIKKMGFVNRENEMVNYYSAADILLYPSLADNLPLTLLESMSCQTPAVAFDVGGISEIITHQKNGYLAKYKDKDDLMKGINKFKETAFRIKCGYESRKKIVKNFNLKKMILNYEKLYLSLSKS